MNQKKPERDRTIEDTHSERQRMAVKFGGNIMAILEDARKRQEASGQAVWQGSSSNKALPPILPATADCNENIPFQQAGSV